MRCPHQAARITNYKLNSGQKSGKVYEETLKQYVSLTSCQ
jgi:hypothetical protein